MRRSIRRRIQQWMRRRARARYGLMPLADTLVNIRYGMWDDTTSSQE